MSAFFYFLFLFFFFSDRLKTDQLATQAQLLFTCCHQLYRALRASIPGSHWSKELRPLEAEISAIERAVGMIGKKILTDFD